MTCWLSHEKAGRRAHQASAPGNAVGADKTALKANRSNSLEAAVCYSTAERPKAIKSGLSLRALQARAKIAPGTPYYVGRAFTGRIERLLPEAARLLAEDYFRLLCLPLREPRRLRHRAA